MILGLRLAAGLLDAQAVSGRPAVARGDAREGSRSGNRTRREAARHGPGRQTDRSTRGRRVPHLTRAAASARPACASPSGLGSARSRARRLKNSCIGSCARAKSRAARTPARARHRPRRARCKLVAKRSGRSTTRGDTGRRLYGNHTLGRNAFPIRDGRLGDADPARKLGDAANSANRLLEPLIPHLPISWAP